jgi:hypothetical protein
MPKPLALQRIFKLRDKLAKTLSPYITRTISGETVKDLTSDLYGTLPPTVSYDAVFETCRGLAGQKLCLKTASELAWRIAGNLDNLISGLPVTPWGRQLTDEWWPVQILRLDPAYKRGRTGFNVRFRALAGPYCPNIFEQFLSRPSCAVIARSIGFSRSRPYAHHSHLVNLRLSVYIEAARSVESPYFKEVACSATMRDYNSTLIDVRVRNTPCPRDYAHLCENCALGCGSCPAAIFQQDLVVKHCEKCESEQAFDLTRSDVICLSCWYHHRVSQYDKAGL